MEKVIGEDSLVFELDGDVTLKPEECKLLYRYKSKPYGMYTLVSVYINPNSREIISIEMYCPPVIDNNIFYPVGLSYEKIMKDFDKLKK